MNRNDVLVHNIRNSGFITLDQEQVFQGKNAQQLPVFRYITGIDRLFVNSRPPDAGKRFVNCHIRTKRDILRRHNRACTVFGITQNFVDFPAHLRICLGKNPLDHISRHLLYKVNGIIHIELVNHFPQFAVGEALDQQFLQIRIHLHKRLGCKFLGQKPEQQGDSCLFEFLKNSRNICAVHCDEHIFQCGIFFYFEQRSQRTFNSNVVFRHCKFLLLLQCQSGRKVQHRTGQNRVYYITNQETHTQGHKCTSMLFRPCPVPLLLPASMTFPPCFCKIVIDFRPVSGYFQIRVLSRKMRKNNRGTDCVYYCKNFFTRPASRTARAIFPRSGRTKGSTHQERAVPTAIAPARRA